MNRRTFLKRAAAFGAALALPVRGAVADESPELCPLPTGGVVTSPQLALVGELGPETIFPIGMEPCIGEEGPELVMLPTEEEAQVMCVWAIMEGDDRLERTSLAFLRAYSEAS